MLGLLSFATAAILARVALRPESPAIGRWAMAVQIVVAIVLVAWGIKRARDPSPAPSRLDQLHPRVFFLETWRRMDKEARDERIARKKAGLGYDYRPLVVLAVG